MEETQHVPVLVREIGALFQPQRHDCLLDATLGAGGHARAYLEEAPDTTVVGIDADPLALTYAREKLQKFGKRVTCINGHFAHLGALLNDSRKGGGIVPPLFNHILFDLGMGSHQLADPTRAFSFRADSPLTMRYGREDDLPPAGLASLNWLADRLGRYPDAADLVRHLTRDDLVEVLKVYGEERYAQRIAAAIKDTGSSATAKELAERIQKAVPSRYERGRIHPATRTFQALRLAVNRELESLVAALPQAVAVLADGGILAVISFHSLEDRIVKKFFKEEMQKGKGEILTKKPIRSTLEEVKANPRARPAKLRALKKTTILG